MSLLKNTGIPKEVIQLLIRVFILFIVWKFVYHFFFYNNRVLDKPLTNLTAISTQTFLQAVYPKDSFSNYQKVKSFSVTDTTKVYSVVIKRNNKHVIGIADGCNALDIYIICIGFILAIPRGIKRMLLYIIIGVLSIYIANTARAIILAIMNIKYNQINDFAHHYLFKLIVYGIVFFIWVKYLKTSKTKNEA